MLTGISVDLGSINDLRKTAVINNELSRLDVDIVALQETRLAEAASLREKDYTFYWHGKPKDERREHGVGFAVKNSLLKMIEPPTNSSERILTMRLNTTTCPVTLISVYAPTLMASSDTKDEFYENLCATLLKVPPKDHVILLGDFNARVGSDYEAWPSCLGKLNVGKVNENGQRLLEFCTRLNLCVANSFFQTKPQNKVSWRHPRSKHWHQLDLVLVRRSNLNSIKVVRSYHSADCDTDHLLVCCKVKLSPKKMFFSKAKGKPRLNTANMQDPVLVSQFTNLFEKEYSIIESDQAEKRWQSLKSAMHSCALATFGRKKTKSSDWFETKSKILNPVIVKKRQMQCVYNKHPSRENLYKLRQARNEAKQMVRRCANDYWMELSQHIENASATGNIRAMYEGIKTATGPTQIKSAPLKSSSGELIVDKGKQLDRWKEHYSVLYSRQSSVSESALAAMEQLSVLHELDEMPTISELSKAIDQLAPGKAPGKGEVPQDMRDTKIVTLYKNKGERSDCNNYRGISLLSIVGKVYARVLLVRLQNLAERVYPESQYSEINKRIGKAAGTLSKLTDRVWEISTWKVSTKMSVYSACILSTLLYGSETWTPYARQEERLQIFHLRNLRFILGIKINRRRKHGSFSRSRLSEVNSIVSPLYKKQQQERKENVDRRKRASFPESHQSPTISARNSSWGEV
ncbi:uncharacterized protein LOC125036961 [Penaeus chinensis]|uniref:uncharacterized protein LOC125036961 n=1 Tax=Penaeus chinensis TaxID=139456 RepID=UPI001FB5E029|nr:uncharacterized protein LOC125036961 [Penaeus chinensis]